MAASAAKRVAALLLLGAAVGASGDAHGVAVVDPLHPVAVVPGADVHAVDPHAAAVDPHAAAEAHGEGHADAHGEEHGAHGHHGASDVGVTSAACLLGMVAAFHVLFYLVNCKYKLVRLMTWKMSSSTVSIFIAILIWSVILTLHEEYFVPVVGFIHVPHLPVLFFTVIWSVCQLGLYLWKDDRANTATIAMLGGHVTGFCAINAFAALQEAEYSASPLKASSCALVFAAYTAVLAQVYIRIRHVIAMADDGKLDETEKMWIEKCQEFEDEVVALVMGFLIAQGVRFAAVGVYVNDHAAPQEVAGAFKMIAAGSIFVFLTMCMIFVRTSLKKAGKTVDRLCAVTCHVLGMTSAWCTMFGLKRWIVASLFAELKSLMMAMVVMAMFDTMLASAIVIAMQQVVANFTVNTKVLRSIISSTSLVVGLSWEKTFHHAIHSMAHSGKLGNEHDATLMLSIGLTLVVLPAWKWHILPKADHRLAQEVAVEEDEDVRGLVDESGSGSEEEESHGHAEKARNLAVAEGPFSPAGRDEPPGCMKSCTGCFGR